MCVEEVFCRIQHVFEFVTMAAQSITLSLMPCIKIIPIVCRPDIKKPEASFKLLLHGKVLGLCIARIAEGSAVLCQVHTCVMRCRQADIYEGYILSRVGAEHLAHPVEGIV